MPPILPIINRFNFIQETTFVLFSPLKMHACLITPPSSSLIISMAKPHFLLLLIYSLCFLQGKSSPWLQEQDTEPDVFSVRGRGDTDTASSCDYSVGKWVFDPSYPLYDSNCPYLSTAVTCQKNGRPDSAYQKWRWQPHACALPRFDALKFLGKMRRKRIILVGDSIMRNQWESLVCLVQGVIPTAHKKIAYNGPTMAFHALDFETSIEFCWAPLLVELSRGDANKRTLHLDRIEENARYWRGADILVFDSAHWWTHSEETISWDYIMEGQRLYKSMNPMIAYQKGLTTWAKWIELNLDPRKTRVIFRSMSPRHNKQNGWKCYKQKTPLAAFSHPHVPEQFLVLKGVLERMSFPIYLQDITTMSAFRRDGHPSVYRRALGQADMQHVKEFPSDCSHWCLPGVPDSWNEILTALL